MKKIISVLFAISAATYGNIAYAQCSTHTYFVNGKMVTCTTCCYFGNCTTNCY